MKLREPEKLIQIGVANNVTCVQAVFGSGRVKDGISSIEDGTESPFKLGQL